MSAPTCVRCKTTEAVFHVFLAPDDGREESLLRGYRANTGAPLCQGCLDRLRRESPGLADLGMTWAAAPICGPCGAVIVPPARATDDGRGGFWCVSCIPF